MLKESSVRYLLLPYYVSVSAHLVAIVIVASYRTIGVLQSNTPCLFPIAFHTSVCLRAYSRARVTHRPRRTSPRPDSLGPNPSLSPTHSPTHPGQSP